MRVVRGWKMGQGKGREEDKGGIEIRTEVEGRHDISERAKL